MKKCELELEIGIVKWSCKLKHSEIVRNQSQDTKKTEDDEVIYVNVYPHI